MKAFSVNGFTKSGKTTVVEHVVAELKRRGYTVGSVKEIHFEQFKMDTPGTNTDRHAKAGASPVTARGLYETDVLFPEPLPIGKILSFYEQDYCVLESVGDANVPMILTAHNIGEIDERFCGRAFAISGVLANERKEYRGLPVIHCVDETARLVDLIERKVPELMPDFDADCCTACGCGCRALLEKILAGEKTRDDCVIARGGVELTVDGAPIKMVPFVQNILRNAVLGVAKELQGYRKGANIEVTLRGVE